MSQRELTLLFDYQSRLFIYLRAHDVEGKNINYLVMRLAKHGLWFRNYPISNLNAQCV